jgi:outer membrane receptor protein involved in Fe transport
MVSVAFFYKDFDQPIERVIEATAQLRTSFRNAESARNYGFEFDVRKNLGSIFESMENFNLSANYTLVDSDVVIPEGEQLVVLTSLARPLAGQSRHVFNTMFEYQNPKYATVARGMVNFRGRRISDVGAFGIPDIFEEGYTTLDAVFIQPFGGEKQWAFKASATNLLDQEVQFTQGGLPQRLFRTGRGFSFSISYSFFKE